MEPRKKPAFNMRSSWTIAPLTILAVALVTALTVYIEGNPTGDYIGPENAPTLSEADTSFEESLEEPNAPELELSGDAVTPEDTDEFISVPESDAANAGGDGQTEEQASNMDEGAEDGDDS